LLEAEPKIPIGVTVTEQIQSIQLRDRARYLMPRIGPLRFAETAMASLLDYFVGGDTQNLSDPGDPSMPYGPPLWPTSDIRAADTARGPAQIELQQKPSQAPVWPQPQPDTSWVISTAQPFASAADVAARTPSRAPQPPAHLRLIPDVPPQEQRPPEEHIDVGMRTQQQDGRVPVPPMPLQPLWSPPPWPEPHMDTAWLDHRPLASDANTVAARRVSQAVRPDGGRKEGPLTSLPEDLLIPKTPLDWAMYAAGGPGMRLGVKALMLGLGIALQPSDAEAGPAGKLFSALGISAEHIRYPQIYNKSPREIAQEAAAFATPESPSMKRLFGVSRDDLFEMSKRVGNQTPIVFPEGMRGSGYAELLANKLNADRLVASMLEMQKQYPDHARAMAGYFPMDPAYERLVQLRGKEDGGRLFDDVNAFSGLASPGSSVELEWNRGLGAHYLNQQGRFGDFAEYAGVSQGNRGPDFPQDMTGIAGHYYHKTAHVKPMQRYVDAGKLDMLSPKVPVYIPSSGVPERGFQTQFPVIDVNISRSTGLADVRKGRAATLAELYTLAPWYAREVAGPLGLTPIQTEALQWGTYGPQTGIRSAIGVPKLETLSNSIMETARRLGISPEQARDQILLGEIYPAYGKVPMTPATFKGR
jgi:hypothetical protein